MWGFGSREYRHSDSFSAGTPKQAKRNNYKEKSNALQNTFYFEYSTYGAAPLKGTTPCVLSIRPERLYFYEVESPGS